MRFNLFTGLTVACLTLWSTSILAYPTYNPGANDGCHQCHSTFTNRGTLHDMHVGSSQMTRICTLCHMSTGDNPQLDASGTDPNHSCNGCHVGPGLRAHHANAGAPPDAKGDLCADCHVGDSTPALESTLPPYYTRTDVNVKLPCEPSSASSGEDYSGDGKGLDNDGDLLYDRSDTDCGPVPVQELQWGGIKALYRQ